MFTKDMVNQFNNNGELNFGSAFSHIKELFANSDIVIGNLETPVSDSHCSLSNESFSFCAPNEYIEALRDCGIKLVSTANNHCLDRGVKGLLSTLDCLDRAGVMHTGTRRTIHEKNYLTLNYDGLNIAIVSYTYGTNAFYNGNYLNLKDALKVNLFQHQELFCKLGKYIYDNPSSVLSSIFRRIYKKLFPREITQEAFERDSPSLFRTICMKNTISKAKKNSDLLIMCLHIGGQFNKKEKKRTVRFVQKLHKKGVNIVIANHEHLIHKIDTSHIKQGILSAYCLGNFYAPYGVSEEPYDRYANYSIALNIYISKSSKRIEKVSYNILQTVKDSIMESPHSQMHVVNSFDFFKKGNTLGDIEDEVKMAEIQNVSIRTGFQSNTIKNEYFIYDNSSNN